MVDKKEQFVYALKGWTYKGILNDWYYMTNNPTWTIYGPSISGTVDTIFQIIIPADTIEREECTQERGILFLTDRTYYVLGQTNG